MSTTTPVTPPVAPAEDRNAKRAFARSPEPGSPAERGRVGQRRHILSQAEREDGTFGMVTALVVN